MPFEERSSSTDPRRLCYHKTPTHDPNQYWGSVTFWYGSGSSDPYLWQTDPDADPGGPKTHGSVSPSLIRTYIARLADPDPHSFRFIKILIRFYRSFDLKDLDPLLFLLNGSILRVRIWTKRMRICNPGNSLTGIRILTTELAKQIAIIQKSEYMIRG